MNQNGQAHWTIAEYATWYVARGWPVFPVHSVRDGACTCRKGAKCPSKGKHPRTRNGVNGASADPETVRAWWQKWPQANIGVATGEASGLVVLDVDRDHGGAGSMQRLQTDLGNLPPAPMAQTGGGGWHVLFRHPERQVHNRVGIATGVDVRADNGYIVAPTSIHASGRPYQWVQPPDKLAPPELPEAWLAWLTKPDCYTASTPVVTQQAQHIQQSQASSAVSGNQNSVENKFSTSPSEGSRTDAIQDAIDASLPQRAGERNRRIFELVRRLKGIPGVLEQPPAVLRKIVNAWWVKAKPKTSGQHSADDCWFDFLAAMQNVRSAWGVNPMQDVIQRVQAGELPEVARDYEDPRVQGLIGMCAALQKQVAPGEPFFLSTHQAGEVLKAYPMEVYRWLKGLCLSGVLKLHKKGDRKRASEYRYLGGD